MTETRNKLLTITDVAKALGKSRWTIRRWITAGHIRAIKIGEKTYIPCKEFERFMQQGGE